MTEQWAFPTFVGHRRRLKPDDPLFTDDVAIHDEVTRAAARAAARDLPHHAAQEAALARAGLAAALRRRHECATCHASHPTAHLLDCHVAEVHDSFWAAQAARRMPVYACLVEGCGRTCCTVEERKQHLIDHHRFPRSLHMDRVHLRRKKGQVRPLPQFQRSTAKAAAGKGASGGDEGSGAEESPGPHAELSNDLAEGFSRLGMATETSKVPPSVAFGRRRGGRGMPGLGARRKSPPPDQAME